jgi:hypothetical protein
MAILPTGSRNPPGKAICDAPSLDISHYLYLYTIDLFRVTDC